jgi:hypothetical protein
VAVSSALSVPVALVLAFTGWIWTPAVAGGEPHPGQGTALWAASAVLLGGGFGIPAGPSWRRRALVGAGTGVVWFVVGRFVLSAG